MAKLTVNKRKWNKPSKLLQNMSLGGYAKAIKNRKTDLDWLSYNEENVKNYIADPYCGHVNTCGFYHEFLKGMNQLYKNKNIKKISPDSKILIVSGQDDPVGNRGKGIVKLEKMYKKLGVKDVQVILYSKMRHEILNENKYQTVIDDIKNFINK